MSGPDLSAEQSDNSFSAPSKAPIRTILVPHTRVDREGAGSAVLMNMTSAALLSRQTR